MTASANEARRSPRPVRIYSITYLDAEGYTVSTTPEALLQLGPGSGPPVRRIPHNAGIFNTPGRFFSATDDAHLECESWLEARWLQLLDYDPDIAEIHSQPLTLCALDAHGVVNHTPDVLARRVDGSVLLLDVKGPHRLAHADTVRRACVAHAAGTILGWEYYLKGEPPRERSRTVAWLAGYRQLYGGDHLIRPILAAASSPIELRDLWARIGSPGLSRSVTFHLMWTHRLGLDLGARLSESSLVWSQE